MKQWWIFNKLFFYLISSTILAFYFLWLINFFLALFNLIKLIIQIFYIFYF